MGTWNVLNFREMEKGGGLRPAPEVVGRLMLQEAAPSEPPDLQCPENKLEPDRDAPRPMAGPRVPGSCTDNAGTHSHNLPSAPLASANSSLPNYSNPQASPTQVVLTARY